MKYQHLIEKIQKTQHAIQEQIDASRPVDELPADLLRKAGAANAWVVEANKALGEAEVPFDAPNMDPANDYALALHTYEDMFDEKTRSKITEYEELVDELFHMIKEPSNG